MSRLLPPTPSVVPPSAPDVESAVLGALMIGKHEIPLIMDILPTDAFYVPEHRLIAQAMYAIATEGRVVDLLTVTQHLIRAGQLEQVGGAYAIADLTGKVSSSANIEAHATIVLEKYIARRLQGMASFAGVINEQANVFEVMDAMRGQLTELESMVNSQAPIRSLAQIVAEIADDRNKPKLFSLGLDPAMDQQVRVGPGDIVAIGARPAVGKTATALNIAQNIAEQGGKLGFISLEMSARQLGSRSAASGTQLNSNDITRGELEEEHRERIAAWATLNGAWMGNVFLDDRATLSVSQIMGLFARMKKKYEVDGIILDYLQLVKALGKRGSVDDMEDVCNTLKAAAKQEQVFLIELSQLTREADGVRPEAKHLRGAGQIEAASDIIILLQRALGSDRLSLYLDKHKFGDTGSWNIHYNLSTQKIGGGVPFSPRLPAAALQQPDDDDNPFDTNPYDTNPF